ncbi:MAG: insulinase family protein [Firmicutes bacterium]|jgi:predicted Zn-dependent peptidase|nr:insulinase family protein [Bacillota bacterium]
MPSTQLTKNGLRVVTHEMPHMRSASCTIWIGAGARYEAQEINGISHFIEHLLFKGTRKRASNLKISQAIEGVGGSINGFTDKEATCYLVKVPANEFSLGIDVLSDIVLNSLFTEEAIEKERGVIIEEIKMSRDRADSWVHILLEDMIWPNHPMGRSTAGTLDSVAGMTRDTILDYYKSFYHPGNIVVSVAGNVKQEEVVHAVSGLFEGKKGYGENTFQPVDDKANGPLIKIETRDTKQANVALGFPGYSRLHPRRYVLELLDFILGQGMSSRLFQEVRVERGLAYSVGSQYSPYLDTGILRIYAGVDPEKTKDTISVILNELSKMKEAPVTYDELRMAKDFVKGSLSLRLEDTLSLALRNGGHMILLGKIISVEEVLRKIDAVTLDEIQYVAGEILKKEKLSLAVIGPFDEGNTLTEAVELSML